MPPVRVAIVGLSASATTSWAANAHLPYLLSERGKKHYEIVALLNSTYSDPNALATDPDVDLVVVCTRVDNHFSAVEPSVRVGKSVYIEWPIAENHARAASLLSGKPGGLFPDSIAGLQGRVGPIVPVLKSLLRGGRIGRVLSSEVRSFGFPFPRDSLPDFFATALERRIGGNTIVVAYIHLVNSHVHEVLGDLAEGFQSRMQIQRPSVTILGKDGAPVRTAQSDVPDLLLIQGRIAPGKADIVEDATLDISYRSGPPFKGDSPFVWTINGEKGEIRVSLPVGHMSPHHAPYIIELHNHATDQVEKVEWDWPEWQKELPIPARAVGELYERYARWVEGGKPAGKLPDDQEWPRIHDAVVRHKELEILFARYDKQK